jgi:hypothetical protein
MNERELQSDPQRNHKELHIFEIRYFTILLLEVTDWR